MLLRPGASICTSGASTKKLMTQKRTQLVRVRVRARARARARVRP